MPVMATEDKIMEIDPIESRVRKKHTFKVQTVQQKQKRKTKMNTCREVKCFCPRVLAPDGVTAPLVRQYKANEIEIS